MLTAGDPGGFTATNFLLTSGELSGVMTFLGTTNWVGSDFNTPGTATIGATGTINITSGNNHDFNGHTIVNNGTVNWTAGSVRSGNGGVITLASAWTPPFGGPFRDALDVHAADADERLDLGCALRHGAFEVLLDDGTVEIGEGAGALMFFLTRLFQRLQSIGSPMAIDLREYARSLQADEFTLVATDGSEK